MKTNLLTRIKLAGLPPPIQEHRFHPKRKWKFDLAWIDLRLAVEVEGQNSRQNGRWVYGGGRHNRPKGFREDIDKYNAATLAGWRLIRVTTAMVNDGSALAVIEEAIRTFQPKDKGATHV